MISLPQVQIACDLCGKHVEVEIEPAFIGGETDFYFDVDEWMEEHGWRRLTAPYEVACPKHRAETGPPK